MRRIAILAGLAVVPFVVLAIGFATYIVLGVASGNDEPAGRLVGSGVAAPVTIVRDGRFVPHIRARNERDLFFAEGYVQGCDRLFQLDLYRRLVEGRLSEILGSVALQADVDARTIDVAAIARAQLAALPPAQRRHLDAFAAGVNLAMDTRPTPVEFRVLAYRPQPWTPIDSLAASFATVLALTDSWNDVAMRADVAAELGPRARDAFFSISDPHYDTPTTGGARAPVAPLPPLVLSHPTAPPLYASAPDARAGRGSNAFAAGAALTRTHRALLASDPHLELRMPGVWWLADLSAPGLHVAGATLAGVPGIVLGHNAHLAWGATNGSVTTVRVFRERFRSATSDEYRAGNRYLRVDKRVERFVVRFGRPFDRTYLRTRHGFVFDDRGATKLAADWTADADRRSSFEQFDGLGRAPNVAAAMRVLARYPGPPQNFVLADDGGRVGYALAGGIPRDEAWGSATHDGASDDAATVRDVPADALPHVAAARDALVISANARPYGRGYPYRLTSAFTPPYRAARIAADLRVRPYDVTGFARVQADVYSAPERELAVAMTRALERTRRTSDPDLRDAYDTMRTFDGRFVGESHAAVVVTALRRAAAERLVRLHMSAPLGRRYLAFDDGQAFVAVLRMLRDRPRGWVPRDDYDAFLVEALRDGVTHLGPGRTATTWSDVGSRIAQHPLASLGFGAWNGVRFPGLGDPYAPHVQAPANAQSFRAVWDVGNWNAGSLVIPQGESGKPGSIHYRDLANTWLDGSLVPLPFGEAAVDRARASQFELAP
ncbi:MAG: penicillin acylase family protein [Vulcanimicrobiaceae bacterium]